MESVGVSVVAARPPLLVITHPHSKVKVSFPVRLLSYNIHKGIGGRDRRYRLERILEVIGHERPDLICLQEVTHRVRRLRYHDQAVILEKHFGLSAKMYQMNVHYKDQVSGYGNLLLSRWPLSERHQISLRMKAKKPRGAQIAVIQTPQGPLRLVNWHLGLGQRERHWQVGHLLDHRLYRQSAGLPTLIAGDFNDWRNTLCKKLFEPVGFVQATAPLSRFRSFPAWLAVGSLDKAFGCPAVDIRHAKIVRSRLARAASDHLPLVIDFDL